MSGLFYLVRKTKKENKKTGEHLYESNCDMVTKYHLKINKKYNLNTLT